jgi:hypothetical protein
MLEDDWFLCKYMYIYMYILIDLVPVFYDLKIDYVCFNLEYIINICSSCFVFSIFLTINKLCFFVLFIKKIYLFGDQVREYRRI